MVTIIELNDIDAAAFLMFRKYQTKIALLIENRVLELQNGSAEIHFNQQGDIASIDMHAKVFRRSVLVDIPVAIVKEVL